MRVSSAYQPIFRELGIDADAVFTHELIKPWRTLEDRENCTLDAPLRDGRKVRWHIKRYPAARRTPVQADDEARGHLTLENSQIPTAVLVAHGTLPNRRSFIIFDDLAGYQAGDKAIESGTP